MRKVLILLFILSLISGGVQASVTEVGITLETIATEYSGGQGGMSCDCDTCCRHPDTNRCIRCPPPPAETSMTTNVEWLELLNKEKQCSLFSTN